MSGPLETFDLKQPPVFISTEETRIFNSMRDEVNYPYSIEGLRELMSYLNYYFDTSKGTMVELGSYAGQSACIFSEYFEKVIAIDPWEDYDELEGIDMSTVETVFDKYTGLKQNIEKRKGYSVEESKTFEDGSLDFVYIDARHEEQYVLEDIDAWLPKLKKHGFIGGHDFYLYPVINPWVGKAVLSKFDKDDVLIFSDCSWLVKCNTIKSIEKDVLYIPPYVEPTEEQLEWIEEGSFPPMFHYFGNVPHSKRNTWKDNCKKHGWKPEGRFV